MAELTLNLRAGTLAFGANATSSSSTYTSNVNMTVAGGVLSLQNNIVGDVL